MKFNSLRNKQPTSVFALTQVHKAYHKYSTVETNQNKQTT